MTKPLAPLTLAQKRQGQAARRRGLRPEDLREVPELTAASARRIYPRRNPEPQPLSMHLDADVFAWVRSLSERKLNTLLRAAMKAAQP